MPVRHVPTILAIALLIVIAPPARAQIAADAKPCTSSHWLPPRPVRTPESYTVLAPRASVLPLEGETLLATWPLRTNDSVGNIVYPSTCAKSGPSTYWRTVSTRT